MAVPGAFSRKASPFAPRGAVVHQHRQVGREPLGLLLPVADDGRRADQQHGALAVAAPLALEQASVWMVLPRPMSSARHAPRPQRWRKASQE